MSLVGFETDGKVERKCILGHGFIENSNQSAVIRMLDVVTEAKRRIFDLSLYNLSNERGRRK